ncbi:hypothetical protein M9Y10_035666 [Tritrichomonas musculus]|uniref:Uncharacterized protein n=1 Tax=Tritrichomonas musculus TaxID=1915356 RepID=A0ABR2GX69_9EUKA
MNNNIGVFTSNPNHRNELPNTNKEDLILNIYDQGKNKDNDYGSLADERFQYAGALIAVCIVSDLPQQMKLASFVWEYMAKNKIENVECF